MATTATGVTLCCVLSRSLVLAVLVLALLVVAVPGASAASCSDHATQAAAQRAGDTRDGDGDGLLCEGLPCPCAGSSDPGTAPAPGASAPAGSCVRPKGVQSIAFSATRFAGIRAHYRRALARGWPRILVVNRPGSDRRRDRLLEDVATRSGFDRDEYPPAVGRGAGRTALKRGSDPVGWRASVAYVDSAENRSHGAVLGAKLRRLCDGVRFRYVFY